MTNSPFHLVFQLGRLEVTFGHQEQGPWEKGGRKTEKKDKRTNSDIVD